MKFVVRYWSSLLPNDFLERRNEPRWVDYSIHPASKIGLHNAMLAVHDRCEIMQVHGCRFECAVFVVESDISERLSQETANSLFASLPSGDVKWLDSKDFLLPVPPILMTQRHSTSRQHQVNSCPFSITCTRRMTTSMSHHILLTLLPDNNWSVCSRPGQHFSGVRWLA